MCIDRIHMTVGVPSKELQSFVLEQLEGLEDVQKDILPQGKLRLHRKQYTTRLDYYPSKKNRKIADIELGISKAAYCYFRLGLYPSQFHANEFEQLKKVLELHFDCFCYPNLFNTGRVSYLELAADTLSQPAHSFIPFRRRCNHSEIYIDKIGAKGSTYLGSRLSDLRFCFYDKHKQLVEKGQPAITQIQTRIEARQKYLKFPASELAKHGNPFEQLEIADVSAARKVWAATHWQHFLDACLTQGSGSTLKLHSKLQRATYLKLLRSVRAPWWNSEHVWLDFPKAVHAIAP